MNDQERIALMNKIINSDGEAITEIELNKAERKVFDEVSSFYRILIAEHIKDKENLKRSNRMLENKINKQRKELRRLHEENEDLKEENNTLKEIREFNKGTIELLLERINGKELSDYSTTITERTESIIKAMERGSKQWFLQQTKKETSSTN